MPPPKRHSVLLTQNNQEDPGFGLLNMQLCGSIGGNLPSKILSHIEVHQEVSVNVHSISSLHEAIKTGVESQPRELFT